MAVVTEATAVDTAAAAMAVMVATGTHFSFNITSQFFTFMRTN